MGATDFMTLSKGASVKEAFQNAVTQARFEDGHGGYTGTIAEKDGFVVVDAVVRSKAEAYRLAYDLINDYDGTTEASRIANDKWGPAAAIPVCLSAGDKQRTITHKVKLDPSRTFETEDLKRILLLEGKVGGNELVERVSADVDERHRVEARRTEGKVVTRYFYATPVWGLREGSVTNWLSGFTTMAKWRQHAKALADQHGGRYECIGISRRFDTEPLDVVEAVITKRNATIKADIVTPGDATTTEAWLFFGLASC